MTTKYGELIVLGYNGQSRNDNDRNVLPHNSRFELLKRPRPNGVIKFRDHAVDDREKTELLKSSFHSVTYTLCRNKSVVVEYRLDENSDMLQIGRSSEPQIDFTVVDTYLGVDCFSPDIFNKPSQSTISRFACRILVQRDEPHEARVFAAGFDSSKNIFLGEKATKWHKKNVNNDGATTTATMYAWREVSVDGDVYTLRKTRSSPTRGEKVDNESNILRDGTLIDLCGATLLFRSANGLACSPTREDLDQTLDRLNAGRPVCPVNLNTLIIPRRKSDSLFDSERQPYCYSNCGHVQGRHAWGHKDKSSNKDSIEKHRCPMCNTESGRIIQLTMGMEPTFHLDSSALNYAFNPCGHIASEKTVNNKNLCILKMQH
uniref:Pellino n=1 Tax=Romanomermis culicivorax TaxID=13658 RepID=A0A915J8T8_ROMCU